MVVYLLRQILAMTQPNHLNTTPKIVLDWDWTAFEKKANGLPKWDFDLQYLLNNPFVAFITLVNISLKNPF
jgi:hypothetical protein